MISGVVL